MRLLNPVSYFRSGLSYLRLLKARRELVLELARQEFTERYATNLLGVVWGFAHPVLVVLIYIFVFTVVFRANIGSLAERLPFDFTVYILSGLIPWMAFADVLNRGTHVIVGSTNLVKQVIFPVEVLPAKTVLAAVLTELILLAGLLVYLLIRFHTLPVTALLLPVLLAFQVTFMLGLSLALSALGAYFRDLKDFIQVFCLMNIYLMPVVYLPDWTPRIFRPFIYVNPFSYQTWCFQDMFFYGSIEHPWAWVAFGAMATLSLGVGHRIFTKLKVSFGDVL